LSLKVTLFPAHKGFLLQFIKGRVVQTASEGSQGLHKVGLCEVWATGGISQGRTAQGRNFARQGLHLAGASRGKAFTRRGFHKAGLRKAGISQGGASHGKGLHEASSRGGGFTRPGISRGQGFNKARGFRRPGTSLGMGRRWATAEVDSGSQ
jgi:hypothetical protein